jgi:hypothetical protein
VAGDKEGIWYVQKQNYQGTEHNQGRTRKNEKEGGVGRGERDMKKLPN